MPRDIIVTDTLPVRAAFVGNTELAPIDTKSTENRPVQLDAPPTTAVTPITADPPDMARLVDAAPIVLVTTADADRQIVAAAVVPPIRARGVSKKMPFAAIVTDTLPVGAAFVGNTELAPIDTKSIVINPDLVPAPPNTTVTPITADPPTDPLPVVDMAESGLAVMAVTDVHPAHIAADPPSRTFCVTRVAVENRFAPSNVMETDPVGGEFVRYTLDGPGLQVPLPLMQVQVNDPSVFTHAAVATSQL